MITKAEGDAAGQVRLCFHYCFNLDPPCSKLTVMQEKRDRLFGRVTAYKALVQSSILSGHQSSSFEDWQSVVDHISTIARSVPWLREECGSMLCDFINTSSDISLVELVKEIVTKFSTEGLVDTPESVAIWLTVQQKFPEVSLPDGVWKNRDPLHNKNRSKLARALYDFEETKTSDVDKTSAIKKGTWKPQVNFAWNIVLQEAFRKESSLNKLRQFWIEIVDSTSSDF